MSALGQNLCVDIQGAGATPGKPATTYTCHGGDNQQLTFQSKGAVTLSGGTMCLDIKGAQANDGDPVQMWTCHGGANQQWRYVSDGLSAYRTVVGQNGKYLEVPGSNTAPLHPARGPDLRQRPEPAVGAAVSSRWQLDGPGGACSRLRPGLRA